MFALSLQYDSFDLNNIALLFSQSQSTVFTTSIYTNIQLLLSRPDTTARNFEVLPEPKICRLQATINRYSHLGNRTRKHVTQLHTGYTINNDNKYKLHTTSFKSTSNLTCKET